VKPVDQDRFGANGNCFAACIASLLDISLAEVPDSGHQGYEKPLADFLRPCGLAYCEVYVGNMTRLKADDPPLPELHLGWQPLVYSQPHPMCVICGPSPNGPWSHACVGRANGWGYELLHDPNPSRKGILSLERIGYFVALDPAAAPREIEVVELRKVVAAAENWSDAPMGDANLAVGQLTDAIDAYRVARAKREGK